MVKFLALLCAIMVTDLPSVAIQSFAWIAMIHDRAPEMGFGDAVSDTLSGRNPCEICLAIQDQSDRESKDNPVPESSPRGVLKFAHISRQTVPISPVYLDLSNHWPHPVVWTLPGKDIDRVPTPPPEVA